MMPHADKKIVFVRNPDLIATDMYGDTLMMSIEYGEYYGFGGGRSPGLGTIGASRFHGGPA